MCDTKQLEESEINLKELFIIIWKYKFLIIFVTIIGVILAIILALSKPNQYKIYTVLAPDQYRVYTFLVPQGSSMDGNKMPGINIGEEVKITPDVYFKNLLNNYVFMKNFIIKRKIDKKLLNVEKDYKFALNYDKIYKFLHHKKNNSKKIGVYSVYKLLSHNIKVSTNKKNENGIINISFIHPSRHFAYYVLTSFLEDGTKFLVNKNLQDINLQINNYQKELKRTGNIEIKAELGRLISSLIKQRVYINSTKYYRVKVISEPYIPDEEDKVKPRRGVIIAIGFIESLILGILLSFLINFLRNKEQDKNENYKL